MSFDIACYYKKFKKQIRELKTYWMGFKKKCKFNITRYIHVFLIDICNASYIVIADNTVWLQCIFKSYLKLSIDCTILHNRRMKNIKFHMINSLQH